MTDTFNLSETLATIASDKTDTAQLQAYVNRYVKETLERECMAQFGRSYAGVMMRFNSIMTLIEQGDTPTDEQNEIIVFVAERGAVLKAFEKQYGIKVTV